MHGTPRRSRAPFFLALFASLYVAFLSVGRAHDRIGTKVTWDREIAPIVRARCVSCHTPGGRGPMSLASYEEARPWAEAIREEVLARRMPIWHAVRGYGDFLNDPSLSPFEIALITAWVDGGAPLSLPRPPVAGTPAVAPRAHTPPPTREVTIPCTATRLPGGRILALRPLLAHDGAARVDVTVNGFEEPLLWVKGSDSERPETYWLRHPLTATRETRARITASPSCRLTVLLAAGTAP